MKKNEIDAQNINEDRLILNDIEKKLEERKNQIEIDEKYKKAEEELYKLKKESNNLKEKENLKISKDNLLIKINDTFNLSKEDMIIEFNNIKKDYESLVSINEEKMCLKKNIIDWKIPLIEKNNEKSSHIKLLNFILQYNSSLEVIRQIDEIKMTNDKSKIIKYSSNLQRNNEFKSLINYIISLQNYKNFDMEIAKSICRAKLMLKIYKNNISQDELINFFSNLDEKKIIWDKFYIQTMKMMKKKIKFKIKTKF